MADFVKVGSGKINKGFDKSDKDEDKQSSQSRTVDIEDSIDGTVLEEEEEEPKKSKTSSGFSDTFGASVQTKPTRVKCNPSPITIKLSSQKANEPLTTLKRTSASVASVFNQESDEEEEMPPEAKMRMRNIGRDTPTSAGPNSFGKTRQGFCDSKKVFERQLKKKMEEVSNN